MQHLILPIAYEYNPELTIVSINRYSAIDETRGTFVIRISFLTFGIMFIRNACLGVRITPAVYGHLIQWLSPLANGRLVVCEQGAGDNSVYRKRCLLECCKGLLGQPLSKLYAVNGPSPETKDVVRRVIQNYNGTWRSLQIWNNDSKRLKIEILAIRFVTIRSTRRRYKAIKQPLY